MSTADAPQHQTASERISVRLVQLGDWRGETFARGAALADRTGLFNASLESDTLRAIDLHKGDVVDEAAFKTLIPHAVALNSAKKAKRA